MPATASYTITYIATGAVGSPLVDINIYIKENAAPNYTLAYTEVNAAVGVPYSYTFNNLPSHTVHQVKIESVCSGGGVQFGDIQYLVNPECQPFTVAVNGLSLDVTWEMYTPVNGDSVLQYVIEYKDALSVGPYATEVVPIATILNYWSTNPGAYPYYVHNITAGIAPGVSYDVRLNATLQFDYSLDPITTVFPSQIQIGPCTQGGGPVVTGLVEQLENDDSGLQENNNFSILEQ